MERREPPAFEQLQADLIRCMNRYTRHPDPGTAGIVAELLQGILEHPLIELFPAPHFVGGHSTSALYWSTLLTAVKR